MEAFIGGEMRGSAGLMRVGTAEYGTPVECGDGGNEGDDGPNISVRTALGSAFVESEKSRSN